MSLASQVSTSPFGLGPSPSPPFLGLAAAPSASPFLGLAAQPAAQAYGGPTMPQGLNNNEKTLFLFSQAVSNGDVAQVQTLLNNAYVCENIHKAVDPYDDPPLYIAIQTGNSAIFDAIVQSGDFDVNANQKHSYLCAAITNTRGNYAMIRTLIAKGAALDIHDDYGDPLACAVTVPDKQIYDILVSAGANPGKKYTTPTYNAPDLFTFLLGEAKPLYLAGQQYRDEYVSIAKDILTNYEPDVSDAAFIAEKLAFCDYPELLQALVSKGVDMNPGGIGAQTAVLCCSFDYFKQLQTYGFVDPKQTYTGQTNSGRTFSDSTLLHLASSMTRLVDYPKFIDLLVTMNMDLYAMDSEGFSPLTRTIDTLLNGYYPDRDICEYLISALVKKGVDVKRPDGNGVTPLAMVEGFANNDKIKSIIRSAAGTTGGAYRRRRGRKTQRRKQSRRRRSRRRN